MLVTFLVLGGIVIGVLGASAAVLTVGQSKKNKEEALAEAQNEPAPEEPVKEEPQEEPKEEPQEEPVEEEPQEEPVEEEPQEEPQEEPVEEEPAEEPQEEPVAEEPAEEPVEEEPAEEPVEEEPQEEPAEEPQEEEPVAEEPAEEPVEEEPQEEPAEEPAPAEEGDGKAAAAVAAGIALGVGVAALAGGAAQEGEEGYDRRGKIMYAYEMTPAMREKVGCVGAIYDERIYRVTFSYSFNARLALADEEARNFYTDFIEEASHYKKIKLRESRRQMRIGIGRDRIGIIYFKGQKLCIAYALSREEVDYDALKIKDISNKARFAETPAMLCLTSGLKCRRAKMLLGQIAEKYGIPRKEEQAYEPKMPVTDREELYRSEDIKIIATLIQSSPAEANR